MNWYRWDGDELVLQLKLQPGARSDEFAGLHADRLKVKLRAPAREGRANAALLAFLATTFATHRAQVRLEQGLLDAYKRVRIAGVSRIPAGLSELGMQPLS